MGLISKKTKNTGFEKSTSEFLPIALLVISVLVFFGEVVCSQKTLFGSDYLLHFHPLKTFIRDHVLGHHAIPLWNPHNLSGAPLLGNIQTAMFYPLGFLFYLIPAKQAYGYTIMIHCALSAIFMYVFMRSLHTNKAAAFLSAVVFTYNGFFMGHLYAGHLTFVQNYSWIPLIFLFVNRFCTLLNLRYAFLAGLFLGIQILGGFPQIAFYTIIALILFGSYHIVARLKHGDRDSILRICGGMFLIVFFGFALSAVQLLPTYEFSRLSTRGGGVTYKFATMGSFHPVNLLTFLMPNFFGNPVNGTYWRTLDNWQFWELCGYVGITPLLLMVFLKKTSRIGNALTFFVLLLLLSLFLSLGKYNPVYPLIYQLPGFGHFRLPAQILYLIVFSLSVLAGMGLHGIGEFRCISGPYKIFLSAGLLFFGLMILALFLYPVQFLYVIFKFTGPSGLTPASIPRIHETIRLSLFTGAGFLALSAALIYLNRRDRLGVTVLAIALVCVTVADIWSFSNPLVRTIRLERSEKKQNLLHTVNADRDVFRVVTTDNTFNPSDGLLFGYQDIQGYDPLILKRYLTYVNTSQNTPAFSEAVNVQYIRNWDTPLIRLLNVKYAISAEKGAFRLKHYMPRAFIVHKAVTLPEENILEYMMKDDFNPLETVVFEDSPKIRESIRRNAGSSVKHTQQEIDRKYPEIYIDQCRITDYSNDRIVLTARLREPGYLVLSEISYPGWKAYVDGEKVELLTGNYVFRTVSLPAGSHDVVFRYEPLSFYIGSVISIAALIGFCCILLAMIVRRRR